MKKFPIIVFIFAALQFFVACKNEKAVKQAASIAFDTILLKDSSATCNEGECFRYSIQYLSAKGGDAMVAQAISDTISKYITYELMDYVMDSMAAPKIPDVLKLLRNDYDARLKELLQFPADERFIHYEIEIETRESHRNTKVVCIEKNGFYNTGGAHPNSNTTLLTFDALTGKTINLKDICMDETGLVKVVEEYLRKSHEIPANETLEDAGFLYNGDIKILPLPVDFSVSATGIRVRYNAYEIAPYATGPSDFEIPFAALEKVLKLDKIR